MPVSWKRVSVRKEPKTAINDFTCRNPNCKIKAGYDDDDPDICMGDHTMLLCCNCSKLKGWKDNLYREYACEQCKVRWPQVVEREKELKRKEDQKRRGISDRPKTCLAGCFNPAKGIHHFRCPNWKSAEELAEEAEKERRRKEEEELLKEMERAEETDNEMRADAATRARILGPDRGNSREKSRQTNQERSHERSQEAGSADGKETMSEKADGKNSQSGVLSRRTSKSRAS
jgi:hypothetical protein